MKKIPTIALTSLIAICSCAPKGPTTFETGIFNRNVGQVSLNTKKISKNTKEIEHNLEETRAVSQRMGAPEKKEEVAESK